MMRWTRSTGEVSARGPLLGHFIILIFKTWNEQAVLYSFKTWDEQAIVKMTTYHHFLCEVKGI